MYREYAPPEPLAPFVECFWRRDMAAGDADDRGVVLPDGRVDVIWVGGGEPLVAGPQTRSVPRPVDPPLTVIGARFHPGVGPVLLDVPATELVDRHVPLAAVDTARAAALSRQLPTLADPAEAAPAIAAGLNAWLAAAEPPDPVVRAAVRLLDAAEARVGQVARHVGYSERELGRRFRTSVGYGPKVLQRVLRFQRMLDELARNQESLARLAATAGYSDQAHMTREARDLSGVTPAQLTRRPL
jgi:AraC-like DNA-binding protein